MEQCSIHRMKNTNLKWGKALSTLCTVVFHQCQVREGLIKFLHCGLQESIMVYPKTSGISVQDELSITDTFFCNKTRATCPVSYLRKTFLPNTHQIYRWDCREDSTKTLSRKFCASSSQIKRNTTRMTALILANVTQKVTHHCFHHQWQWLLAITPHWLQQLTALGAD